MMANNETGTLQPLKALAGAVKRHDSSILIHTDATQAVGKIHIDLSGDLADVDFLSLSAHKFHGPKGVGALFIRDAGILAPIQFGGGQQLGMRSGTENPAGVVGMITALTTLLSASSEMAALMHLRTRLETGIVGIYSSAFVLGASVSRLPTTVNVCLPEIDAEEFVDRMALKNIAISSGSACSYGANRPSHVALAHGLSYEHAKSCVRISLSIESTEQEVELFLQEFAVLMAEYGVPSRHKLETA